MPENPTRPTTIDPRDYWHHVGWLDARLIKELTEWWAEWERYGIEDVRWIFWFDN